MLSWCFFIAVVLLQHSVSLSKIISNINKQYNNNNIRNYVKILFLRNNNSNIKDYAKIQEFNYFNMIFGYTLF